MMEIAENDLLRVLLDFEWPEDVVHITNKGLTATEAMAICKYLIERIKEK